MILMNASFDYSISFLSNQTSAHKYLKIWLAILFHYLLILNWCFFFVFCPSNVWEDWKKVIDLWSRHKIGMKDLLAESASLYWQGFEWFRITFLAIVNIHFLLQQWIIREEKHVAEDACELCTVIDRIKANSDPKESLCGWWSSDVIFFFFMGS